MAAALFLSELRVDRALTDEALDRLLAGDAVTQGPVLEAMRYAVLGSGQRLRPLLAYRVARTLGRECAGTLRAALAVELVHCASLIVDDLPCMDDSPMRRGRPSTHVTFGEPVALLAAFSLIALASRSLLEGDLDHAELRALVRFQRRLLSTLDSGSLIAGQAMDVQMTGDTRSRHMAQISELKTVPLFQLAVHAGGLFAPSSPALDAQLDRLGYDIGMLYQMLDDKLDGEDCDETALREQFAVTAERVKQFGERSYLLADMLEFLYGKAFEKDRSHR